MLEHEARIGRQLDIVHAYLGSGPVLTNDVVTLARRSATTALVDWRVANHRADGDGAMRPLTGSTAPRPTTWKDLWPGNHHIDRVM
jgi:hypothetical protein